MNSAGKTYLIAELSANHNGDIQRGIETIHAAAQAGADAIKIQTYTADTMTIQCDNEHFMISGGTAWDGRTLHDLYQEAYTPWEWHAEFKKTAVECGLDFFSTPFDATAVDFLEDLGVDIHKVASFEVVDIPLLRKIGSTKKSVIMSTGMASLEEIQDAVDALKSSGCPEITLLKCTSAYPAEPKNANLLAMPELGSRFGCSFGLSDHTLGVSVPVAAVALGATVVEKHFTLAREDGGADSGFSLEPHEFREMVDAVRIVEQSLGDVKFGAGQSEEKSLIFRRSLFVVKDIAEGEAFTPENVRSIRPGYGLLPKHMDRVLASVAACDLSRGTPLEEAHVKS